MRTKKEPVKKKNEVGTQLILLSLLLSVAGCAQPEKESERKEWERIEPTYFETDVPSLIRIHGVRDIAEVRKTLIHYVWGESGFPSSEVPDVITKNITDKRYAELYRANLQHIDKLSIGMDYGLKSIAYHFIPKKSNTQLIVYHQGHNGDFIKGINTIRACLERRYAVMAFSMPLLGMNNQPTVDLERFGKFKLTKHDHLKLLDNPMKYFLEPVVVGLNYAAEYGYTKIHMTGISGGGWTTTLCAGIDPRIAHSYPVAGSLPIYLRSNSKRDWGDYEQTEPNFYRIANYLELYVMGAHGDGRKQIQILNQYDSCCFAGIKYRTYERAVKEVVTQLGPGEFLVFLDETHKEHKISEQALSVIFANLGD